MTMYFGPGAFVSKIKIELTWKFDFVINVKNMFNNFEFGYVLENSNLVQDNSFISEYKCKLVDYLQQEWHGKMKNSPVWAMYKVFKASLDHEEYLY